MSRIRPDLQIEKGLPSGNKVLAKPDGKTEVVQIEPYKVSPTTWVVDDAGIYENTPGQFEIPSLPYAKDVDTAFSIGGKVFKYNSSGGYFELVFDSVVKVIEASENDIATFATNSGNYTFNSGDFITIPDGVGGYNLFIYNGGTKTDTNSYLPLDISQIDWSQVNNTPTTLAGYGITDAATAAQGNLADSSVQSVTGTGVDDTDPKNPVVNIPEQICSVQSYPTFEDLPVDGKDCVLYIADGKYYIYGEAYCDYQNPMNLFEPLFNSFEELPNPGDPAFTYALDLGGGNFELYVWVDGAYQPVYFNGGLYPPEWTEGQYAYVGGGFMKIVVGCREYQDVSPEVPEITEVPWGLITGTPTDLGGYGVTQVPWGLITGTPTDLGGYGVTQVPWGLITGAPTDENTNIMNTSGLENIGPRYHAISHELFFGGRPGGQFLIQNHFSGGAVRFGRLNIDEYHVWLEMNGYGIQAIHNRGVVILTGQSLSGRHITKSTYLKLVAGADGSTLPQLQYVQPQADDINDTTSFRKFVTQAEKDAIANSTLNTDTDVSGNDWVLDEDDMASDSDTKVPTQQSVKAYVDGEIGDLAIVATTGSSTDLSDSSDIVRNSADSYPSEQKINQIVTLTQAEYDAIVTKDPNTMYVIPEI